MNLFDDLLKYLNQSPPVNLPRSPSLADEYDRYRLAMAQQQAQQNSGLMNMGVVSSLGACGPAGAITRSGLGYARASEPVRLPESTVITAIIGWRRWLVTMFGSQLFSNNGTPWEPFQRLTADCAKRYACQGYTCGCGIYAYKTRELAEKGDNAPSAITHIWGEVWLWGRIIECEHGFRAQFAYPKALVDTGSIAQQVAIAYGVEVIAPTITVPEPSSQSAICPHGVPAGERCYLCAEGTYLPRLDPSNGLTAKIRP